MLDSLGESLDEAHLAGFDNLGGYIGAQWPRFECEAHHARLINELELVEAAVARVQASGDVEDTRNLRVIVTFPPRHGKSLICSEHFPAWFLGRDPQRYIIAATYAQELADDFGRKTRNQMRDPLYQRVFPGVGLTKDSAAASRFNTPQGGAYFALGRNGSMTGRGAHMLLLDDMFKGREEADSDVIRAKVKQIYAEAAYTRLMPGGAIVLIGTRWHDDDLIGWVLKEHKHENWKVVDFQALRFEGDEPKALWPSKYPVSALMRIRKVIGERGFQALYQQKPFTEEGAIIKRGWWQHHTEAAPTPDFIIVSVDTAYTADDEGDASACTVWYVCGDDKDHRQKILMRYAWAKKLEFPELVDEIKATWDFFGRKGVAARLLVEAKASGLSVIQELRKRIEDLPVWAINPKGDKVARAYSCQPAFEAGKVYAMANPVSAGSDPDAVPIFKPWAEQVIDQCVRFPRADDKDLVDSVTQAIRHLRDMGIQLTPEDDPAPPGMDSRGRPRTRHRQDGARPYGVIR